MMMPKQNPVKPAPPMAPSWVAVKPNSPAQLSKMPPRMPKPMPAAKIAIKPAHNSRLALGTMATLLTGTLLIGGLNVVDLAEQKGPNAGGYRTSQTGPRVAAGRGPGARAGGFSKQGLKQ